MDAKVEFYCYSSWEGEEEEEKEREEWKKRGE